jgi:hypothetical protein
MFVKLQPYAQNSAVSNPTTSSHFVILGLFLPTAKSMQCHMKFGFLNLVYSVFHVSQLKLAKGPTHQVNVTIPDLDLKLQILLSILDHCLWPFVNLLANWSLKSLCIGQRGLRLWPLRRMNNYWLGQSPCKRLAFAGVGDSEVCWLFRREAQGKKGNVLDLLRHRQRRLVLQRWYWWWFWQRWTCISTIILLSANIYPVQPYIKHL